MSTLRERNLWGKYREVRRTTFKAQTAYRMDVWVGAAMPIVRVFLAYALWKVLFIGKTEIGGFTLPMMIAYYLLTSFFARLDQSNGMVWEMADEIREGRFARFMTKPISPLGHFISVALSKTGYVFGLNLVFLILIGVFFFRDLHVPLSIPVLLGILCLFFLGLVFQALLNFYIASMAFRFNDIVGLQLVKQNGIDFLAGSLIPLSLLPDPVVEVMRYLPFYSLQYLPASILVGNSSDELPRAIFTLFIWCCVLLFLAHVTYQRLSKQFEGVGS